MQKNKIAKKSEHLPGNYNQIKTSSYRPYRHSSPKSNNRNTILSIFKILLIVIVIIVLVLSVIFIWDIINFSSASKKLFNSNNVWEVLKTRPLKKDSRDRTNFLLVGYSVDDPNHGGAELTDSLLVLSLDNNKKSGYMLSIPRDLYVNIPGYKQARINEAYQVGQSTSLNNSGDEDGGMKLLEQIIHDDFGIEIHYHALINYSSVRQTVDALGGIEVKINSDDPRGIYDPNFPQNQGGPLQLSNGLQKIDGPTALRLTRARGSTYGSYGFANSDFSRTKNQQQVFLAIKNKMNWKLLLDPRENAKIFESVSSGVITNLDIHELAPFYRLFSSVPSNHLKPVTLSNVNGRNLLADYTENGQSLLIPALGIGDFAEIKSAVANLDD